MTSGNLRKLAADSNVILSAVTGRAALKVFLRPEIELITTRFNILEVEEYIPRLASKYGLDERSVLLQLRMLPVVIFEPKHYHSHTLQATRLLKDRDPDDVHLAALALKEGIPIWSNDRDFEKLSLQVYTTAQLLKVLKFR
jgi:predicted nucleic acid-binding protein